MNDTATYVAPAIAVGLIVWLGVTVVFLVSSWTTFVRRDVPALIAVTLGLFALGHVSTAIVATVYSGVIAFLKYLGHRWLMARRRRRRAA